MSGCIHRGTRNDASTQMGYASSSTYCYQGNQSIPIQMQHQENYCLCANHINCPLLNDEHSAISLEQIQRDAIPHDKPKSLPFLNWLFQRVATFF